MNDKLIPIGASLCFILAMIFVFNSLTAKVISESCCSGPYCNEENLCDYTKPVLENPQNIKPIDLTIGVSFLLLGILILMQKGIREEK